MSQHFSCQSLLPLRTLYPTFPKNKTLLRNPLSLPSISPKPFILFSLLVCLRSSEVSYRAANVIMAQLVPNLSFTPRVLGQRDACRQWGSKCLQGVEVQQGLTGLESTLLSLEICDEEGG